MRSARTDEVAKTYWALVSMRHIETLQVLPDGTYTWDVRRKNYPSRETKGLWIRTRDTLLLDPETEQPARFVIHEGSLILPGHWGEPALFAGPGGSTEGTFALLETYRAAARAAKSR